jgi:DNA modification methylase
MEIMPTLDLSCVDAVLCDPPYGCKVATNYADARFGGPNSVAKYAKGNTHKPVHGDDEPFDPSHLLEYPKAIIWGYQFMADKLPQGTVLVWQKKNDAELGCFLSDGEAAWQKGGQGLYIYHHRWYGFLRQTERGKVIHPTQKPVALMRWCLDRLKLEPGATVLDPYMGSGPVGVACAEAGFKYIGIEIEEDYYNIAKSRIEAAYAQTSLFT